MSNILDFLGDSDTSANDSPPPLINKLSNEQQLLILKAWEGENTPSIEELCELCWPKMGYDGRSKQGKLIKTFLIQKDLKATTKTEYQKKSLIDLSEPNKEYIRNNPNMKAREIAAVLWNQPNILAVSAEARAVSNYQKELENDGVFTKEIQDDEPTEKYNPPKTLEHAIARIGKYIRDSKLDAKNISSQNKKNCQSLVSYLHSYVFNYQINSFNKQDDKDLFESVFVSYCYDKPDLTKEELDKMAILATEKVIASSKLKLINTLEREQDKSLEETGKIAMNIIEAINTQTNEYNQSIKRQQSLYNDLTEKRSERLKGKIKESASVLHLVELWKNEESRNRMIKIANQRKEKLKEEIDRLENMDDLICSINGLSKDEALNG